MSDLMLKVCGMRDPENVKGLIDLKPDFMGFIFYLKSPRYVSELDEDFLLRVPPCIKKVGVFVNEKPDLVQSLVNRYGLDYVQLHGDENLGYIKELKVNKVRIIKAFRLTDSLPPEVSGYEKYVDYFLFDTYTSGYGGSGRNFDWNMLRNYDLETPFLLSGGVKLEDVEKIKTLNINKLIGIDVNSRFEIEPGLKDLQMLKQLKAII